MKQIFSMNKFFCLICATIWVINSHAAYAHPAPADVEQHVAKIHAD